MGLLETARLRLRHFTADDVDRLVELDSDPEVMRYITFGAPTPREQYVDDFLPRWFAIYCETPVLGYWAAEERATSEFLGWFHLRPDRIEAGEQELGYRLRRASWGRGFATEGAAALVEHGFGRVGADDLGACARRQRASQAVMQKCGLRYEADFVYPQDMIAARSAAECAAVKYSITRSQWQAARRLEEALAVAAARVAFGSPRQISAVRARSVSTTCARSAPWPHSSSLVLSCSRRMRVRW